MSRPTFCDMARESDMNARRSMGLAVLPVVLVAWVVAIWWLA